MPRYHPRVEYWPSTGRWMSLCGGRIKDFATKEEADADLEARRPPSKAKPPLKLWLPTLHYSIKDEGTSRWLVVFEGNTIAQTFRTQEGAETYLEYLRRLHMYRRGRGRPKANRIEFYEPTHQWKVYVKNEFQELVSNELQAIELMENLATQQIR